MGTSSEDESIIFRVDCDCRCGTRLEVDLYSGDGEPLMLGIATRAEDNSFRLWDWSLWRTLRARLWTARREAWAILMNRPEWHEVILRSSEVSSLSTVLNLLVSAELQRDLEDGGGTERGFVPGSGSSM